MLYHKKYRIQSHRMVNQNYSAPGHYFITMCTRNRLPWFGSIHNNVMCVNNMGSIIYDVWNGIPQRFNNIRIDEFIVMPDHIHGIIRIVSIVPPVETLHATSLPNHMEPIPNQHFANISPKRGSLSVIVRSFKSAATREIRKENPQFKWQSNYHDRVIRTKRELHNVRNYIRNNPKGK